MRCKFQIRKGGAVVDMIQMEVSRTETLQEIKGKFQRTYGFPISSQTLLINGNVVTDAAELLSAGESKIIHINVAMPPDAIIVRFQMGEEPPVAPTAVNLEKKASQLRSVLKGVMGIETPASFKFFHNNKRVKENRTFKANKIRDGAIIEIPASSIVGGGLEYWEKIIYSLGDQTQRESLPPSVEEDMITVKAVFGDDQSLRMEVGAAQKVGVVRPRVSLVMLLPAVGELSFIHNEKALDEELSFREQNVGDGDVLQMVYSSASIVEEEVAVRDDKIINSLSDLTLGASSTPSREEDVMITVKAVFRYQSFSLKVGAARKVGTLRPRMNREILALPTYGELSFVHNEDVLNEQLSFKDQNVADGDMINLSINWFLPRQ